MPAKTQTTLQCSNCGTPNTVELRRIINANEDPKGKQQLLAGRINSFPCRNCGQVNRVSSPLLYHDAEKQMLIAFVPMDVAAQNQLSGKTRNEEQIVGELMNDLTSEIPKENFRAYMFNPKRALTMQGLIEQVLEADGVSPEMLQAQQERVRLVETFLQAGSEEELKRLVTEYDDRIDREFLQTFTLLAQQLMQDGQQQVAQQLVLIQQAVIEQASIGRHLREQQQAQEAVVQEVADRLNTLDGSEDEIVANIIDLALAYHGDEERLQAMVGLIRPVLDETFYEELTGRMANADAATSAALVELRDQLQQYSQEVDQQMRGLMEQRVQMLQALLNSPNPERILQQNPEVIDDNFMQVLSANIQEAERRQDMQVAAKLRSIYETVVAMLEAQMTPELRFINELLSTESPEAEARLIAEKGGQFDEELLRTLDAVEEMMRSQGQPRFVQRIQSIRTSLQTTLG